MALTGACRHNYNVLFVARVQCHVMFIIFVMFVMFVIFVMFVMVVMVVIAVMVVMASRLSCPDHF